MPNSDNKKKNNKKNCNSFLIITIPTSLKQNIQASVCKHASKWYANKKKHLLKRKIVNFHSYCILLTKAPNSFPGKNDIPGNETKPQKSNSLQRMP